MLSLVPSNIFSIFFANTVAAIIKPTNFSIFGINICLFTSEKRAQVFTVAAVGIGINCWFQVTQGYPGNGTV